MHKRILIFGNGKLAGSYLKHIKPGDYIVGVDRAAYWLIGRGVVPDVAIGDFDSATEKEFRLIQKTVPNILRFPPEKDRTDMDLVLQHAAQLRAEETYVFGWSGTRLDHTLAAVHLITNEILIDGTNRIRLASRGRTIIKPGEYKYISVVPKTKSVTLTITGCKYNVRKAVIRQGSTVGISNERSGIQPEIRIFSGQAWIIESND